MVMNSKEYIAQIVSGFEKCIDQVIELTDLVDQKTLNIPEGEGKWSMLQCINHLSLATEGYVTNVEAKLKSTSLAPSTSEFNGSWLGRYFEKTNQPKPNGEIPNKIKPFKRMTPSNDLNRKEVIDEFIVTHQKFIELIKASEAVNLDKTKVPTAIPIIKLRLGDAFKFILAHTRRHVVQLERIKKSIM